MEADMPSGRTVAVIGLGYVGLCLAATLTDRGLDVIGVDIAQRRVDELNSGQLGLYEGGLQDLITRCVASGRLRATTDYAAVSTADVLVVTVGTPITDEGSLADTQLRSACQSLSTHLRPGHLVILKSTVPPGTTRNLVLPLLEGGGLTGGEDFMLSFSPERLAEGTALAELCTFPIVVGGLDDRSTQEAAKFWQETLGVRVMPQASLEAAEIVKLADNWWIDLNIALANELAKFCALYDVDVLDVIAAANTIPKGNGNVNILLPSVGVGGSCLTKDPWMVWQSARRRGLEIRTAPTGREVNAGMPAYTTQLILDDLAARGRNFSEATVAVLGLAFKNNTGDLRSSPAQMVVEALVKEGVRVRVYDPLADAAQVEALLRIQPGTSVHETVRDADCVALLALHREFEDLDFASLPVAESCLVLDGRAYFPKEKIAMIQKLGLGYRGIGR
ncbi:nucleotide sugar dehydrogenase [Streptomyces canus]|uniref:nucleotide sugar dehydrogenase n=1 Tax=Streptomyces canus TaxID=58343 RepID=UPI0036E40673